MIENLNKYPVRKMIWYPTNTTVGSKFLFHFYYFLYHYVPAFFIDIVLKFKGSKIRLMSIYSKAYLAMNQMGYFALNSWKFEDSNKLLMYENMTKEDLLNFPVYADKERAGEVFANGFRGISKYFFRETEEDLIEARKKLQKMRILHYGFLAVFYAVTFALCYKTIGEYCLRMFHVVNDIFTGFSKH